MNHSCWYRILLFLHSPSRNVLAWHFPLKKDNIVVHVVFLYSPCVRVYYSVYIVEKKISLLSNVNESELNNFISFFGKYKNW